MSEGENLAMRELASVVAVTMMLAACGEAGSADSNDDGQLSADEVAAEAASGAIKPEPGQYRADVEVISIDVPGAPAAVVDMMRGAMAGNSSEYCLTQEDVDKGFEEMARQSQNGDCTFNSFNADGGDIDAVMTCSAEGETMTITLDGTGGATSSEMMMTMEGNIPEMGAINMKMKTTHNRIGDCAG